jgi:hypothetical protein
MDALRFDFPMDFTGDYYGNTWAGYKFRDELGYTTGKHPGVDFNYGAGNEDLGLPARSIANGKVVKVGRYLDKGFGRTVIIEHTLHPRLVKIYGVKVMWSRQMHLESVGVVEGQYVKVAQRIGAVGNDGTTWAHDHIELWKNLGSHLNYDKDDTSNYYDVYKFIERHKNETEEDMVTKYMVNVLFKFYYGASKKPTQADYDRYVGKITADDLGARIRAGKPYKILVQRAKTGGIDPVTHMPSELSTAYKPANSTVLDTGNYKVL